MERELTRKEVAFNKTTEGIYLASEIERISKVVQKWLDIEILKQKQNRNKETK